MRSYPFFCDTYDAIASRGGGLTPSFLRLTSKKGVVGMRRTVLLLASMLLTVLLVSAVAWAVTKVGGPGSDVLRGTDASDDLDGRGSEDTLLALGGDDYLLGGDGSDVISAGAGDDQGEGGYGDDTIELGAGDDGWGRRSCAFSGDSGNDTINGNVGSDRISGGTGNDYLADSESEFGGGNEQRDILSGGDGNDQISADNWTSSPFGPWPGGGKDIVDCGSGFDKVWADEGDVVASDCEDVFRWE